MKTVIMAGGKGTRISSIASDIPKPMISIDGMPVLEREITSLRDQGFTDIIITVSHLGHIIMNYFGDGSNISPVTGKPFGVNIEYFYEREPLGSAGALFQMKDKLTDEQIASILNKEGKSKTILVDEKDAGKTIEIHEKEGWKLVKKSQLNDRVKLTFEK